jgi:hypothetical protein
MRFAPADAARPDALRAHLKANELPDGLAAMSRALGKRIAAIETDFRLTPAARTTLDFAAYVLVHGKLLDDLDVWNGVLEQALKEPRADISCVR